MVSFDLSFRTMFTKEIVEDKGALWSEGIISWLYINRGSYKCNGVKVVDGNFSSCIGVSSGSAF